MADTLYDSRSRMFPAQQREGPTSVGRTLPLKLLVATMNTSLAGRNRSRSGLFRPCRLRQDQLSVDHEVDLVGMRGSYDRRFWRRASNVDSAMAAFATMPRAPSVDTEVPAGASFAKGWATGKVGRFKMDFINVIAQFAGRLRPQKAPFGSEAAARRKRRLRRRTLGYSHGDRRVCSRNSAKDTR